MKTSTSRELETFERVSLNKLLLKSRGAPYEEALRRIIKQKLSENLLESRRHNRAVHDNKRDQEISSVYDYTKSAINRGNRGLASERDESQPSESPRSRGAVESRAHQRQHTQQKGGLRSSSNDEQVMDRRCIHLDSSSMQEFHIWLLKNKIVDANNMDQVQYQAKFGCHSLVKKDGVENEFDKENRDTRQQLNLSSISAIQPDSGHKNGVMVRDPLMVYVEKDNRSSGRTLRSGRDGALLRGRSASLRRHGQSPLRTTRSSYHEFSPDGSHSSRSWAGSTASWEQSRGRDRNRSRERGSSVASLTPRSSNSSHYSSISSFADKRAPSYDDRWRDGSPPRPFQPTLLAQATNRKILGVNRVNETFDHRTARSVQNYYIKQAFNCTGSLNTVAGVGGGVDKETSPGIGQYTKSFTIPYDQRHSKNIRNTDNTIPSTKHSFGDEKFEDRFLGRPLSRSGSMSGSDGGCSPGVGQYSKAVVIPYFQRHSVIRSSSRSPTRFQRHTWGSEKYDSFINDYNSDADGSHQVEYGRSDMHHSDQLAASSEQHGESYSSRQYSPNSNTSASHCQQRDFLSRQYSPSSINSCSSSIISRGASRDRADNQIRGPPRTPREYQFRRLIKMISEMGPTARD